MTTPSHPDRPAGNGQAGRADQAHHAKAAGASMAALMEEAQALKELLHEAHGRASRLLVALKRNRAQSKLVQHTMATLRQLHQIDP